MLGAQSVLLGPAGENNLLPCLIWGVALLPDAALGCLALPYCQVGVGVGQRQRDDAPALLEGRREERRAWGLEELKGSWWVSPNREDAEGLLGDWGGLEEQTRRNPTRCREDEGLVLPQERQAPAQMPSGDQLCWKGHEALCRERLSRSWCLPGQQRCQQHPWSTAGSGQ